MEMIKVIGKTKNPNLIKRSSAKIAKDLGIKDEVTIRFMESVGHNVYGCYGNVMGGHIVCVFKNCPDVMLPEVISHEMVHAAQTDRGDLSHDYDNNIFHWCGDKYTTDILKSIPYYDRPWEAEAKKLQKNLAKHFYMS